MRKHLKGFGRAFDKLPWEIRRATSRYQFKGSKKLAQRRIHKMERQEAKRALWE